MQYSTDNVGFIYKTYGETLYCIDFPTISINFIRIWGDFPVTFKVITCNAYLFFFIQYLLVYIKRNYGDFRQCVIPIPIKCILQGTPCDTGIPYTFYGENICSAVLSFCPCVITLTLGVLSKGAVLCGGCWLWAWQISGGLQTCIAERSKVPNG